MESDRDEPRWLEPWPRIMVLLEGSYRHLISITGRREEVVLRRGWGIYWVGNSWTLPRYDEHCIAFGATFVGSCVRLIHCGVAAGKPIRPVSAYHTTQPLTGSGAHVIRALTEQAELGITGPAAQALFISLLHLLRAHLAADIPPRRKHSRAIQTWQVVREYLDVHFDHSVNRETVAGEMGLHPNYLSALARHVAGQSFNQVLEGVRIDQARRLLLDTNLKLHRIANLCGYRTATRLGKAFRRRSGITPGCFRATAEPSLRGRPL